MAKKSSIEKNNRRKRMTKNAAPKRARLKAIIGDKTQADGGAVRRDPEACRDAAQLVGDPHPYALRADGPFALELSQDQTVAVSRCANSAPRAWSRAS